MSSPLDLVALVEAHALTEDAERELLVAVRESAQSLFEVMERAGVDAMRDYRIVDLVRVRSGIQENPLDGDTGPRRWWRRRYLRALVSSHSFGSKTEFHVLHCPCATTFRGYGIHGVQNWRLSWDRPERWRSFAVAVPDLVDELHGRLVRRGEQAREILPDVVRGNEHLEALRAARGAPAQLTGRLWRLL